jgi:small subunit ribosomal protein S21
MLIIKQEKGENIERMLKRFKKKFEKTKVLKELRNRQSYTKPSVKNREMRKKAIYVQTMRNSNVWETE